LADSKITGLPETVSVRTSDLLCVVTDPSGSPVTKKIQVMNYRSRTVAVAASQVVSALSADVSGLTLTVSAGGLYRLESHILFNRSSTSVQSRWGLKFPAMKKTRGTIYVATSAIQGVPAVSSLGAIGVWNGDSASGSAIVAVPAAGSSVTFLSTLAEYTGLLNVSAGGVVIIQAGATSANGSITVLEGSYLTLIRLN
jgi:hypothetical protein